MSAAKIAGAPISWGVCEVPGWGYQLSPPIRHRCERLAADFAQHQHAPPLIVCGGRFRYQSGRDDGARLTIGGGRP